MLIHDSAMGINELKFDLEAKKKTQLPTRRERKERGIPCRCRGHHATDERTGSLTQRQDGDDDEPRPPMGEVFDPPRQEVLNGNRSTETRTFPLVSRQKDPTRV